MRLTLDIETTLSHDHIWMCLVQENDNAPYAVWDREELQQLISMANVIVGHNIIGFDKPVLEDVWGIDFGDVEIRDTMVLAALLEPEERMSLKMLARRHNKKHFKSDFETEDFDSPPTEDMVNYGLDDVRATAELDKILIEKLEMADFSDYSIALEHQVAHIIAEQTRYGVAFDEDGARQLYAELCSRLNTITEELQEKFPPIVTERYSEKTGKRLKDNVEVFNVGSRQQIAKRLQSLGAVFKERTEKGNIIVNEKTLRAIDLPEAKLCEEYLMLQKRTGLLDGWLKHCVNGRIHGRIKTNGAVTGRMSHMSPNLAQVPAVRSPYGVRCRELFIASEGKVLVGCDASGLELRMLAHYMQDDDFIEAVVSGKQEDGTDAHTRNMIAFGLDDRDLAKTLIYALLYGAGDDKLGSIVGGNKRKGAELRANFEAATPAYARLKAKVERLSDSGSLPSLDGRRLWVRSTHSALNTLLQGAGAVVMKEALVIANNALKQSGLWYRWVLNVHDEFQLECYAEDAEQVGELLCKAIKVAGDSLNVRCPLGGEYKVGNNWSMTH